MLLPLAGACGRGPTGAAGTSTALATHKITVAGDSISVGFGAALREAVGADAVVKVIGEDGTGLARPDRFDWPARLTKLAAEFAPQVLVFSVGSNDAQDLVGVDGKVVARFADTNAWNVEYSRRLAMVFDAFASTGTRVVWLGHVRTSDARVGDTNRRIHALASQQAVTRPFVTVDDLAAFLQTGEKSATHCLDPDGLHLTNTCLDKAAAALKPTVSPR